MKYIRNLFVGFIILVLSTSALVLNNNCKQVVQATTFSARTTAPSKSNSYYFSTNNPFYPYIAPNPGYLDSYGNCTWYAWGRAYEILGRRPTGLSTANAKDWYSNTYNFNKGSTPKVGAIMCWAGNHVAVVEKIENGNLTISESSYDGNYGKYGFLFRTKTQSIAATQNYNSGFQGYIYIVDNATVLPDGVNYSTHVQNVGWQATASNGATSGTTGQSKQVEAMQLSLSGIDGGITYRTHVQDMGWTGYSSNGAVSGTTGQNKRVEAFQVYLTGNAAKNYDLYYRSYIQGYGWLGWTSNGASSGSQGMSLRVEAIQIKLVATGGAAPGTTSKPFIKSTPDISYSAYVEGQGWNQYKTNGETAGTTGKSLRLEALRVGILGGQYSGGVEYQAYCENQGWQSWASDFGGAGTTKQSLRLEAIKVKLNGELASHYDVYYRLYVQDYGWLGWSGNGNISGTTSLSKRAEAIQVKLVKKGSGAPGSTDRAYLNSSNINATPTSSISYSAHVQDIGWQSYVSNGSLAGTTGKSLRMEALKIKLINNTTSGGITYQAHVQGQGWQDWANDDGGSGTTKKGLRMEALKIKLTGNISNYYDVYYRIHSETFGWSNWAKNGNACGSTGYSKRIEAIEIKLVKKGSSAPNDGINWTFKEK